MDQKTEQSRSRYNQIGSKYDDSFDGRFTQPFNQFLCDYLPVADGDSVLDVACGNGRLLRMLSQKARINAYGVDVSEEMIASAKKMHQAGVYRVASADRIGFPDHTFNFVTVCCAFHHFTNPDVFLKESYRVLKSKGKLVIGELSPAAFVRWIDNLIIPRMNMGDVRIYKDKELYEFFRKAGFDDITHIKRHNMIIIEGVKK